MEKKKTEAECIYEEIEKFILLMGTYPVGSDVMNNVLKYGEAKYQEGIEDAIEADVHPDIQEEMREAAAEYHEARMEPYQ
jgi:hypothetical protein